MDRDEKLIRKKEKRIEKARKEREKGQSGHKEKRYITFLKTFLLTFVIFVMLGVPVFGLFSKVADTEIFGKDSPILKEELQFLIDKDSPFYEVFTDSDRANILLLGVNKGMTDTIMLVSFDRKAKHVDIISVPRDTYYHREGYNGLAENKINAAYRKDPVNTAKAVSEILLDMPINYYAVVEYDGIEEIVDSMGGVPMDIPNIANSGGMYYNDPKDSPPLKIAIPAGQQLLDGKHAVQFLRYRHGYPEGDLGRVKAQQKFMKSAFKQCLGFDLLKIAKTVFQNVESDIKLGTTVSLATDAMGIGPEDIETYMLPAWADPEPPYYVQPNAKQISNMITEIYSIQPETTSDAAISGAAVTE